MLRPSLRARRLLSCLLLLWLFPASTALGQDDEVRPARGLLASYTMDASGTEVFRRYEAAPAFLLGEGEAPDPRLPAKGWQVVWTGVIEILKPGKYRFAAHSSGDLRVAVAGQMVLEAKVKAVTSSEAVGPEVNLPFGDYPLRIEFTPRAKQKTLKLFWSSDSFGREPLPPHVLGHLSQDPLAVDHFYRGRLMVEEHNCAACHSPSDDLPLSKSLITRPGPRLSAAGARLRWGWIYHWLGDPQSWRPEAVMPQLFTASRPGEVERYAVAAFLASLAQPPADDRPLPPEQAAELVRQGERLFQTSGCLVCHEAQLGQTARATLRLLGQKSTSKLLADYIRNPGENDPSGRMPGFDFSDDEALKLGVYLTHRDAAEARPLTLPQPPTAMELRQALLGTETTAAEREKFAAAPADTQLATLGRHVIEAKGCMNCHELTLPGETQVLRTRPARHSLADIAHSGRAGCLREAGPAALVGKHPQFGSSLDRKAAAAFLDLAKSAPGTSSPGELARLTLQRFNCTGCHERDGRGGLDAGVIARLLENQTEQNAEMVSPPPLTGVTERLLATYLHKVLFDHQRSRPWMSLKMPRFGREQIGHLPAALAALDAEPLRDKPYRAASDGALLEAGRALVGSKGFGCTKCHDMFGAASQGTRGPDLSQVPIRVNYDWFVRWMTDPQRIQPGTRMPTVFLGGKSPYPQILQGDPQQQRLAVWQYLARSRSLPPPEGLRPQHASELAYSDAPLVLRTFLPEMSPRSMAIRYPNGVHLAYDAQSCRLGFAWSGDFLNLAPVWEGRGGMKAAILGPIFWSSPAGFAWEVTTSADAPPDFSTRGQETSLGAELPHDGKLHPTRLHFRGYSTAAAPTFKFDLKLEPGQVASFREAVTSLKSDLSLGVLRDTTIRAPAGRTVWFNAALADEPPRWETSDGESGLMDSTTRRPSHNSVMQIVQQGKPLLLHIRSGTSSAVWSAVPEGNKWFLVVSLPVTKGEVRMVLATWRLNHGQPAALKSIINDEFHQH